MRVLTTIYGLTVSRITVELIECNVDLPDCEPYNTIDWYCVRYFNGDETYVSGDELGPMVIIDDRPDATTRP